MRKSRKVKSLVRPSVYPRKVSDKFGSKHIAQAIIILEESYRTEYPPSCDDEELPLRPSFGDAVYSAREYNKKLRILIAILRKELRRIKAKTKNKIIKGGGYGDVDYFEKFYYLFP